MGSCQLFLWVKILPYISFPDDKKQLAKILQMEALHLSKQQINNGRHAADSSAGAMESAIVLHRHAWLRSTSLPVETMQKIEDLPFEVSTLFSSKTDGQAIPIF